MKGSFCGMRGLSEACEGSLGSRRPQVRWVPLRSPLTYSSCVHMMAKTHPKLSRSARPACRTCLRPLGRRSVVDTAERANMYNYISSWALRSFSILEYRVRTIN